MIQSDNVIESYRALRYRGYIPSPAGNINSITILSIRVHMKIIINAQQIFFLIF